MSMVIYTTPSTLEFTEELVQETRWYELGVYLGIPTHQLDHVQINYSCYGTIRCMIEMYKCLESNNVSRSWENIAKALWRMGNKRLSNEIKEKYAMSIKKSGPAASLIYENNSIIVIDDNVTREYVKLQDNLLNLEQEIKKSLKKKKIAFGDIMRVVIEYCQIGELKGREATIDQLFIDMSRHYCFMNYHVLVDLKNRFLNENKKVSKHLKEYERQLQQLKDSTSLRNLMQQIHEKRETSQNQQTIKIKLQEFWGPVRLQKFEQVCRQIFKLLYQYLINIKVDEGCIQVSWIINNTHYSQIVDTIQSLSDVLPIIGVMSVSIDGEELLHTISFVDCEEIESAMTRAIDKGNILAVDILVMAGANINMTLTDGYTPLMKSCETNRYELVKLFLAKNANINCTTTNGRTALLIATSKGNTDIISLLLNGGADANIADNKMLTPLMEAKRNGYNGIVKLLLQQQAGPNLNLPDDKGYTHLMATASSKGRKDVTEIGDWKEMIETPKPKRVSQQLQVHKHASRDSGTFSPMSSPSPSIMIPNFPLLKPGNSDVMKLRNTGRDSGTYSANSSLTRDSERPLLD